SRGGSQTMKRRDLLGALGAGGFAWSAATEPDLVLLSGNIHTVDAANPHAEAVAITAGRFVAVGSNEEIRRLATARTKKIDLGGKTVVPGFIDTHSHPASSGLRHLREVDCDLRSIAEIRAAIARRAAETPAGEWILGFKYDDTKTAERRPLTRQDLDSAAGNHPVAISHRGGHSFYVNSIALEKADINDKTPDPPGGRFDRDAAGKLTGCARELAKAPISRKIVKEYTRADRQEGVKIISKMMARTGITSVHDTGGTPDDLRAYHDAREAGELKTRVYCFIGNAHITKMIEAGVRTGL